MIRRNRRIGPTVGAAGAATLYTVPASHRSVLTHLHVCNTTTTAITFKMSIGADAAGTRLFSDTSVPANGALSWEGEIPLEAADTLQWNAAATLTVTGRVEELGV